MVRTLVEHPEAYSVMGNIVNNQWTYWHHYHAGAIHPYLADHDYRTVDPPLSWRSSQLPTYMGKLPDTDTDWSREYHPPFDHHRWLRVELDSPPKAMAHTPYGKSNLPAPGCWDPHDGGAGWALGAQSHFSFFENAERGLLKTYHYGNAKDGSHNNWYRHHSINMMAIKGSTVASMVRTIYR